MYQIYLECHVNQTIYYGCSSEMKTKFCLQDTKPLIEYHIIINNLNKNMQLLKTSTMDNLELEASSVT